MVRTQDVLGGVFRVEQAARVPEATYLERTRQAEPRMGDLLYSREGTYFGIAAEVPNGIKVCLGQRMVLLRPDASLVDARYLRLWLNSPQMQRHVHGFRDGSVAERLNLPTIRGLPVAIPSLPEQRRIAAILGALDDKIELNRRMNKTLEEMASAIFKAWFVDFDGVIESGGDLVESELGLIPRGWEVKPVEEVAPSFGGATPSTKKPEFWEGGTIHWTTPKDLSSLTSPVLLDTERKITEAGLGKISSGLLPEGTLLLSSRAPVGYLAIAQVPLAVNQGYIAIPPGGRLSPLWMLFWAGANMDRIKARAGGTTFQEISKRNFRPIQVVVPPEVFSQRFDDVVGPMFERIVNNERESRTLAELRDTLLPKLISGELRVPQAEEMVEDVV
ncbi:MAG: restriction endonuclease subunit S [Deferrisomatales bacterium]|nr:restriction endonuclease subunit S [Deferrisomatales bacterium]